MMENTQSKLTVYIRRNFNLKTLSYILLLSGILLGFWYMIYGGYLIGDWKQPSVEKSKEI